MRAEQVIATHGNTDFDAFASMLAARRLYPGAVACVLGSLNRNVREFWRLHADALEDVVDVGRLDLTAVRRLVVVETTSAARLGELEPVARDPAVEKAVFDHHDSLPDWAPAENVVLSEDGALTTTLVGILAEREVAVTPLEATAFALGIHEDTGSLTYPTATQRDAEALAWCLRHGADQQTLARFLHVPLTDAERDLLNALLDALEPVEESGVEILLGAVRWPEYVDGVSNLAHKVVDLTDCQALALLVEMDDRVFAVIRSRTHDVDAEALAAALGGAGHEQASSAIYRGGLDEARALVTEALPRAVRQPLRARDVMSKPARTVGQDETVAAAMVACQRHRQSGILVADEGRLVGAVSREDLDKAIGHELSHAPVKGIMSSRVATAGEDAPVAELHRLLGTAPGGRIAIVSDDRIAGVVTRRDLLREPAAPADDAEAPSLASELDRLERLRPAFEAIAATSEGYDGVYLVGGTVRDILLGEQSFDVDIAVEGDAIALGRAVADALGGRCHPHERFGTAVVLYGRGDRIDVVTARTEFYDAPAALPTVEHATIREDLFRRDFTINAMAVSLRGEDFGRLVDPFGGRGDLEEGTVRVLHNLSFIDDPTRIFRGVRYEARYDFRMDAQTERLARSCIDMGLVGDLSSSRLRDELVALLDEDAAPRAIVRLGELHADKAIVPHRFHADEPTAAVFTALRSLRDRYGLDVPNWRLGLMALGRELAADELLGWLDRLKVRRRDRDRVAGGVAVGGRIADRVAEEPDLAPAELVQMVEAFAPEAPLFALALTDAPPLHEYFTRLKDVRLEITGADLAGLGLRESPRVGEVLDELRRRKLNGQLDGRDSELAAARELIQSA